MSYQEEERRKEEGVGERRKRKWRGNEKRWKTNKGGSVRKVDWCMMV
jgi:hypothetical protein